MRLTSAIFVGLAASVQADISVDEIAGQRLLSKARKLDSSGQAVSQGWSYGYSQQAQNQNYWNYGTDDQQQQQNQGGDDGYGQYYQNLKSGNSNGNSTQTDRWGNSASENYDVSWMSGYSIKFSGCAVENGKSSSGSGSTKRLLAKFKLCPSTSSCTRCKNSGDYIVDMASFVEAYEDFMLSDNSCAQAEKQCESTCQNSYNNGDDANAQQDQGNVDDGNGGDQATDDQYNATCISSCMANSGVSNCGGDDDKAGYKSYNMQELVNCRRLDYSNENKAPYYVGATCKNGGVYLETFTDARCTKEAAEGTHKSLTGYSLPSQNLVSTQCIGCTGGSSSNNQYQNNGSGQNNNGVCQEVYHDAGKCEKNMKDLPFKNNGACDYIHGELAIRNRDVSSLARDFIMYFIAAFALFIVCGFVLFRYCRRRAPAAVSRDALISAKTLHDGRAPPASDAGSVTEAGSTYQGTAKLTPTESLDPVESARTKGDDETEAPMESTQTTPGSIQDGVMGVKTTTEKRESKDEAEGASKENSVV